MTHDDDELPPCIGVRFRDMGREHLEAYPPTFPAHREAHPLLAATSDNDRHAQDD